MSDELGLGGGDRSADHDPSLTRWRYPICAGLASMAWSGFQGARRLIGRWDGSRARVAMKCSLPGLDEVLRGGYRG